MTPEQKEYYFLGASGLVGSQVVETYGNEETNIIAPSAGELDIRDRDAVFQALAETDADVIVNFVAYADVDGAQKHPKEAWELNVAGLKNLVEAAALEGKHLITIGTDFEFDGLTTHPGPYNENDTQVDLTHIGTYGQTKIEGYRRIKNSGADVTYIRIAYPFGNPRSERDYVKRELEYIKKEYGLFTDQWFTPTYIPDLALALDKVSQDRITGTFHVACNPPTTHYEFGLYLASKLDLKEPVKEGSFDEFMKVRGRTPRPKFGGLNTKFTQNALGIRFHSWQEALDEYLLRVSV